MKVLILILSLNRPPFSDFMRVQQETWDAEQHPDIDVRYYYGSDNGIGTYYYNGKELRVVCSDAYEMMHYKFKLACEQLPYRDYDFIFRTNSCSYIVKDRLLELCKTLPKTNCYAGYDNGKYVSGAGIFFTPDVLDKLLPKITNEPHGAEDVLIGSLLNMPIIAENSRVDADCEGVHSFDGYHFRFKTSNAEKDRYRDIDNMIKLHRELNK